MKRGLLYIGLAYAFSWAWWLPLAFTGTTTAAGIAWPTHLPGLLGPALAAFATTFYFDGAAGVRALARRLVLWRFGSPQYLILLGTAGLILLPLLSKSSLSPDDFLEYSGAGNWGLFTCLYVLALNGFGEEIGWRGFLVDSMLAGHSLLDAAVRVWLVWGLWHLPLFFVVQNFKDLGVGGAIGWAVGLLAGSIWLAWLYQRGSGSILLVALWHTVFNFATATTATAGLAAAVASTAVMIAAIAIAVRPASRLGPQ